MGHCVQMPCCRSSLRKDWTKEQKQLHSIWIIVNKCDDPGVSDDPIRTQHRRGAQHLEAGLNVAFHQWQCSFNNHTLLCWRSLRLYINGLEGTLMESETVKRQWGNLHRCFWCWMNSSCRWAHAHAVRDDEHFFASFVFLDDIQRWILSNNVSSSRSVATRSWIFIGCCKSDSNNARQSCFWTHHSALRSWRRTVLPLKCISLKSVIMQRRGKEHSRWNER